MFRAHVLIIRRSKLHYTASGIITPIGGRLVHEIIRKNSNSTIYDNTQGPDASCKFDSTTFNVPSTLANQPVHWQYYSGNAPHEHRRSQSQFRRRRQFSEQNCHIFHCIL